MKLAFYIIECYNNPIEKKVGTQLSIIIVQFYILRFQAGFVKHIFRFFGHILCVVNRCEPFSRKNKAEIWYKVLKAF